LLIKVYKSFNAQKKFGNHSLTPSNGLGIAATPTVAPVGENPSAKGCLPLG
jgi:hypothetical protein